MSGTDRIEGEFSADFRAIFRTVCARLRKTGNVSLEEQLRQIAQALKAEWEAIARPGSEMQLPPDGGVATILLAGYAGREAHIYSAQVRLNPAQPLSPIRFSIATQT